jgi:hypothetical protein
LTPGQAHHAAILLLAKRGSKPSQRAGIGVQQRPHLVADKCATPACNAPHYSAS